jgi:signal transduction histidine kinase
MQLKNVNESTDEADDTTHVPTVHPIRDAAVVFVALAAILIVPTWLGAPSTAMRIGIACGAIAVAFGAAVIVYRSRVATRRILTAYAASMNELRSAWRKAEERADSREQTLATMSHELRAPLTAIQGFTDIMLAPGYDATSMRSHARTIQRNGQHLLSIMNDILDLARIEAGVLHVESRSCDPLQVASEVIEIFRPRAKERNVALELLSDADIPDVIATDPVRLRQILVNVVGNAVKYTEQGGVLVVARTVSDHSSILFEVSDTGIGIDPECLELLFRPFQRAASGTEKRVEGTGLGLAISKKLARALGGDITVESRRGHGSTFTVVIPATAVPPTELEPGSLTRERSTITWSGVSTHPPHD